MYLCGQEDSLCISDLIRQLRLVLGSLGVAEVLECRLDGSFDSFDSFDSDPWQITLKLLQY